MTDFSINLAIIAAHPTDLNCCYACCCPACAQADVKVATLDNHELLDWIFFALCMTPTYTRYDYRVQKGKSGTVKDDMIIGALDTCCSCPFALISPIKDLGSDYKCCNFSSK